MPGLGQGRAGYGNGCVRLLFAVQLSGEERKERTTAVSWHLIAGLLFWKRRDLLGKASCSSFSRFRVLSASPCVAYLVVAQADELNR